MKAIIIGGGIIGSSIAWRLAREAVTVTLLERGRAGQEASWAAAGMIAPQAEAQGPGAFFDLCVKAREVFAGTVEALRQESGIDPEYDDAGILYVAFDAAEQAELKERARWQSRAGGVAEELSGDEARRLEPELSAEVVYAVHLPNDRRTDNRQLTRAYAAAAVARGATIREGARVEAIITKDARASGVRLHGGEELAADVVINAAGAWAGELRGLGQDRVAIAPIRGQMLCFESLRALAGPAIFSMHGYLVPRRDGRLLAGSTMEEAGYDKRVTLEGIEKISRGARKMMPSLGGMAFREAWAGLRPATRDLMPVLGASPSVAGVFYAAGHFRSGILLSALTGEILADLIHQRTPAIDLKPFSPVRFSAPNQARVMGLVRDMLFRSRIDAAAKVLGVKVAYASTLEQARARYAEIRPAIVFADLSDANFPAAATAAAIKHDGGVGARLVGFAAHVDLKSLASAREAGFDLTLSRSEFTARLKELLR
ncbi:MAG TPA: glycine oxidase ThiO [Candidatus Binataceae bacterium]|nr:glycine oxidase ThiO [Candidatus Binataceae bacterium]